MADRIVTFRTYNEVTGDIVMETDYCIRVWESDWGQWIWRLHRAAGEDHWVPCESPIGLRNVVSQQSAHTSREAIVAAQRTLDLIEKEAQRLTEINRKRVRFTVQEGTIEVTD